MRGGAAAQIPSTWRSWALSDDAAGELRRVYGKGGVASAYIPPLYDDERAAAQQPARTGACAGCTGAPPHAAAAEEGRDAGDERAMIMANAFKLSSLQARAEAATVVARLLILIVADFFGLHHDWGGGSGGGEPRHRFCGLPQ